MGWLLLIFVILGANVAQARTIDLDTIVVQASRSNDTLADTTKDVSMISSQDIADFPAKSLPELLGTTAGVYGVQYGNIKDAQVDLGGFGETAISNVLVLVDGRRTNQIDLSGQDWSQIDLNDVDHIEIIKGAGTVLYGDNASGGVINIITKQGRKSTKPRVTLTSSFGSYQDFQQGLDISGGLRTLGYNVDYSHHQTSGFRANSDYGANDLNTRLDYHPTDSFRIDFNQGYHEDSYQLPGALFISNIRSLGRTGVRSSLNDDHGWTTDSHFDVTPHVKFTAGNSNGEFSLFASERKRLNKYFTGTSVYETDYEINSYEFQPKLVLTTPLNAALMNKATVGYDYFYAKDKTRSGYLGPNEDLVFISKVTHGVYALDELNLNDRWLANVGARGTWAQYGFNQTQQATDKTSRSPTVESYQGGMGYKYNSRSKVYMNYVHSYRMPAVDEFYQNVYTNFGGGGGLNTSLTTQIGNEYHWGIKDNTLKGLNAGLDFYAAQYKNEIYYDPNTFENANYSGRTRHYGVTASTSVKLFDDKIEPFMNLTFQRATFRGGKYAGHDIPFVPDQMANGGIRWRPWQNFSTSLCVAEVGKRFAISDQDNAQPKLKRYHTFDWNARYAFKNMEVWVALRNIFNEQYFSYGVYSSSQDAVGYYPAPGRNVEGGVKWTF